MEENVPVQSIQPTPETQVSLTKSIPSHSSKIKYSLLVVLVFLMMVLVGGVAYYLGVAKQQLAPQKNTNIITNIPTPTITTSPRINFPIGENTVSYANVNGKIILRYQNKFFDKDKSIYEPQEIKLPNENSYKWIGLVDRPQSETAYAFDEMFSFDTLPNDLGFIFVMRWETNPKNLNGGTVNSTYKVFYFVNKTNKLSNVLTFEPFTSQVKYQIPKIDKISPEGQYVSFSMFGCWNCGGHYPETLLLNLETNNTKSIEKVNDFIWGQNGSYNYKEYRVIDCAEPQPGECTTDSATLPLLNGQF